MSDPSTEPAPWSISAAETILHTIYGDDLTGCPVRPDAIANLLELALPPSFVHSQPILDLYEKLLEAIHLLSTPPDKGSVTNPEELRTLLGQRLDNIHALTTRARETIAPLSALTKGKASELPHPLDN